MSCKDNLWNEMLEDKDVKDWIYKDVIRTHQDYKFFIRREIIDYMVSVLYYWSKTYPLFSYRQGMNEILAMVYFAFYSEKSDVNDEVDKKEASEIASDTKLIVQFLFNEKHINADIFIVFEKIMNMGIKELYGTIDDITSIKNQLSESKTNSKDKIFMSKIEQEQEEKRIRVKIEKLYDDERKKSAVIRRWNRIYHNFLRKIDTEIYKHLVKIELDPELQLMRWFRCLLSREFSIEVAMNMWDYIFSGIQDSQRIDRDFCEIYYSDNYIESFDDPLINLDFLWLAMIENIRKRLHKEDLGTWLEIFFDYPEVTNASKLISMANKIERNVTYNSQCGSEFIKIPDIFESPLEDINDERNELKGNESNWKEQSKKYEETKEYNHKPTNPLPTSNIKHIMQNKSHKHTEEAKVHYPSKRITERKK